VPVLAGAGSNSTQKAIELARIAIELGADGALPSYKPYGEQELIIEDSDITAATGLLSARCRFP